MAGDLYDQLPPGDEVAMAVDGKVVSSPRFDGPDFSGPVEISGNFTSKQAAALARKIDQARRAAH
jgi:hypothetical protein